MKNFTLSLQPEINIVITLKLIIKKKYDYCPIKGRREH